MNEKFTLPEFETEGAIIRAPHTNRCDLLEATKISRLPSLPKRQAFNLPDFDLPKPRIACVNCKTGLSNESDYLQSVRVCRKCLGVYAVISGAIEEAEQRKRRETLKRFVSTTGK